LKVLHVLYQSLPNISGSSIRSRDILISQKEIGIDVVAVTSPFQESVSGVQKEVINEITYLRTSRNRKSSISDKTKSALKRFGRLFAIVPFTLKLRKFVLLEKPDVLHAHAMFFCGLPCLLLGKFYKIPVIYEFRSLWMFEKKKVKNKSWLSIGVEQALLRIELLILSKADGAIILNHNLKNTLVAKSKTLSRAVVINNAVNTSLINTKGKKKVVFNRRLVFGYIGTLTPYEGLEFLIEAFQELYDEGLKVQLLIFGKGISTENIKAKITNRPDIELIEYKGSVNPNEIVRAFDKIDVIVNPRLNTTLTNSVTPLKPLEAMAYQKLFLGSDVDGITEIVAEGNGFLFKAEDKNDLKLKIRMILALTDSDKELVINKALSYVKEQKSWSVNAKKYKAIYQNLISTHNI